MRNSFFLLFLIASFLVVSCQRESTNEISISSPSGINKIDFFINAEGKAHYKVTHNDDTVIDTSSMAFDFKDHPSWETNLKITGSSIKSHDETWEMPWGEQRKVRNYYNELVIYLEETTAPNRKVNMYFRAYDDGIAFRYEFLAQTGMDTLIILDERTQFVLSGDHDCWWAPGDWDIYEHLYNTSKFSEIDAISKRNHPNLNQTYIPENAVNTPLTMKAANGVHLSFHEANLTNYSDMTLKVNPETLTMESELVGSDRFGWKVKTPCPFVTPWRTIQIADKAGDLIESKLIVNLNEPNKIGDVSWFKPKKYVGIWWEMHLGVSTWDMESTQDMSTYVDKKATSSKHGATTGNAKRYIDFAAQNGIKGILVEGWNTGWNHWIGFEDREGVFDFVTPYADYDLEEVVRYGREKGVELIMHHETSAAPRTYEQQLDTAYSLMRRLGIHSVKTGYVGKIIPKGEYHHGQWMVNHYRKVLEKGAASQVAINAHEPIKDTGLRRTYPNEIAREGLRGQEFNAWASDGGNPPEHLPIVAFTRMLAGPIDFTPGVFEISLKSKPINQINTTLAQQLALYVVIYSPIQMACDLPENYEGNPALQFIKDVGVDWEQSKVLDGAVGDYVVIAREERETGHWFIGGVTDENQRNVVLDFSFLPKDKTYKATIYKDGANAHYKSNPNNLDIENLTITNDTKYKIKMASGGGFAISLLMNKL